MVRTYSHYWAKTNVKAGPTAWRPFTEHVAAVVLCAEEYLKGNPLFEQRVALLLGYTHAEARQFIVLAAALHDLGKLYTLFQSKVPFRFVETYPKAHLPDYQRGGVHFVGFESAVLHEPKKWNHGVDGFYLAQSQAFNPLILPALAAGSAHHGTLPEWVRNLSQPTRATQIRTWHKTPRAESVQDEQAMREFIADVLALHGAPLVIPTTQMKTRQVQQALVLVAGLVAIADWRGSDENVFICEDSWQVRSYADAYADIRTRKDACQLMKVHKSLPTPTNPLTLKFPDTALQTEMRVCEDPLVLMEAATGDGKTEAALLHFFNLHAQGKADRLVFALPTKATANQMYKRISNYVRQMYGPGVVSVGLGHGDARHALREILAAQEEGGPGAAGFGDGWFRNGTRNLLNAISVVTVDQLEISVLRGHHHWFVRHVGLATALVVIDEIHDADLYQSRILQELLRNLSTGGAHVALMSATLSRHSREMLIASYHQGLQKPLPLVFPTVWGKNPAHATRVTTLSAIGHMATATMPARRTSVQMGVQVRSHSWTVRGGINRPDEDSVQSVLDALISQVEGGATACWIRNTVFDVQELAEFMRSRQQAHPIEVVYLHASLCREDRANAIRTIESVVGKDEIRRPILVLGTDILGVSLDIDFDVLVRDLSTMDKIIQAAGRLWRHDLPVGSRPPKVERVLQVFMPSKSQDLKKYYDFACPGSALALYETRKWLLNAAQISHKFADPNDVEMIIDTIRTKASEEPPPGTKAYERWEEDQRIQTDNRALASMAVISLKPNSTDLLLSDMSKVRTFTRLGIFNHPVFIAEISQNWVVTVPYVDNTPEEPNTIDLSPLLPWLKGKAVNPWEIKRLPVWRELELLVRRSSATRSTLHVTDELMTSDSMSTLFNKLWQDVTEKSPFEKMLFINSKGSQAGWITRARGTPKKVISYNCTYTPKLGLAIQKV